MILRVKISFNGVDKSYNFLFINLITMLHELVLILFLTSANAFFNIDHVKVHCVFSKHMLNIFELNEKYFQLKYPSYANLNYNMEDLKEYAKNLQSQSSIIMIMLDELRMKNPSYFPADLMTVNLYLNNVQGHILMLKNNMPYSRNGVVTDEERLREGFKTNYNTIVRHLINFIDRQCRNFGLCFVPIEPRFQHLIISSKEWTGGNNENQINLVKAAIEKLKEKSYTVFREYMERVSYTEFHPSNMLFFSLMNPYSKYEKEPEVDDGLNLMRHVKVESNAVKNHETNIINLYENILLNFDGNYVKSYQQQVLMATIYPVFECICSYASVFNLLFQTGYTFKYENEKKITALGLSLIKVIRKLVHSNIFGYEVNQYIINLLRELDNYNWYKNINWSTRIIPEIKNVLYINHLELDAKKYHIPKKLLSDIECQALLDETNDKIEKTKNYVEALLTKKKWYKIVKNTVNHSNIFHNEPLNIMSVSIMSSFNPYNINAQKDNKINTEETANTVFDINSPKVDKPDTFNVNTISSNDNSVASPVSYQKDNIKFNEVESILPDTNSLDDASLVPYQKEYSRLDDEESVLPDTISLGDYPNSNSTENDEPNDEPNDELNDEPNDEVSQAELTSNKQNEGQVSRLSKLFSDLADKNAKEQNYSKEIFNRTIKSRNKKISKVSMIPSNASEELSYQHEKINKFEQNIKVSEDEVKQLHCLFSKYVLRFFKLNEKLFILNNYDTNGQGKFGMTNLMNYDANLQSQSQYIKAMLNELRIRKKNYYAKDLMTVNLYLNNLQGNLNIIGSSENVSESPYSDPFSKEEILRNRFIKNYNMIVKYLIESVNSYCKSSCKNIEIDHRFDELCELVNISEKETIYNDPKKILAEIHLMKYHGLATFKQSIDGDNLNDYHPTKMMFYDLMTNNIKFDKSASNSNKQQINEFQKNKQESNDYENGLSNIREVVLASNQTSFTKKTILDAFYCVSSNFRAEYLKSFQQQVLAATVYPILKSVSNYMIAFKQVFYVNNQLLNQIEPMLKVGNSLAENFRNFVNLYILPEKVNGYLVKLLNNVENIINIKSNKSLNKFRHTELVSEVLSLCSKPMLLNRLEFNVEDKPEKRLNNEQFNILLNKLNNEVNKTRNYVTVLSVHRHIYIVIRRSVPHDDMFEIEPLDTMDTCVAD
ncbi:kinesin-related protein 4-like isoform X4 [Daktulosphaira vitifoliae]|uniref:kinesin-related protein 4-like isoform X4 n=1 Tax=Daktulosphaira vitifoliae TaxID=58002 RepID=UPI0021AAFCF6|nr:kinesin-related protein 4-like isoform X4 [Daktulosphaira vitifoliae]